MMLFLETTSIFYLVNLNICLSRMEKKIDKDLKTFQIVLYKTMQKDAHNVDGVNFVDLHLHVFKIGHDIDLTL